MQITTDLDQTDSLQLNLTENGSECLNITPLFQQLQSGVFLLNDMPVVETSTAQNLLQYGIEDEVPLVNIQGLDGSSVLDLSKIAESGLIEFSQPAPIVNSEELLKPFKCDVCDKRFQKKFVLNKHLKIHGRHLPFACTKCKKGFISEDLLDKHLRSHLGYRPFSCQLCNNSFGEEGSLKIHLKRCVCILKQTLFNFVN